uniref:UDP-N-acetylmuramate--L-alanine ligase n=1 Tax=Lygus hesperus TaxID=30085 RepID=A0A0A9ZFH9_LYGHE
MVWTLVYWCWILSQIASAEDASEPCGPQYTDTTAHTVMKYVSEYWSSQRCVSHDSIEKQEGITETVLALLDVCTMGQRDALYAKLSECGAGSKEIQTALLSSMYCGLGELTQP